MAENWDGWEAEEAESLKEIERLREKGHSHHCACRVVWGDGECECDLYTKGYKPYAWMKYNKSLNSERAKSGRIRKARNGSAR